MCIHNLFHLCPSPPPALRLVGAYFLDPQTNMPYFYKINFFNGSCFATEGSITYMRAQTEQNPIFLF